MRLAGRTAIITGSGTGLGRVSALLFAREGAKIVVADISVPHGNETVKLIREAGGSAMFCHTDVARSADCQNMIKVAVENYGRLDIMFNNAGVFSGIAPFADATEETWNNVISVNLTGAFFGTKYAVQQMLKQGGGVIVNTASVAGKNPAAGTGPYGTSKAGLIHLTRVFALEYARNNIRCNCILPFTMDTPFYADMSDDMKRTIMKRTVETSPSGKIPTPEEVASVALFLASDESSFVSGQAIAVDYAARL